MVKKLKIALVYSYDENWIAGTYYILNLINALNTLPDEKKPELFILSYSSDGFDDVKKIGYPYINFKLLFDKDLWAAYSLFDRFINKLYRIIIGKNIIYREHTRRRLRLKADVLFPAIDNVYFSKIKKHLFWIPDFQEHFLPHFFSEAQIKSRKTYQKKLSENACAIVFSSQDALKHFKELYPSYISSLYVLRFAVTHPVYKDISSSKLDEKYKIDRNFFFCPNQIWAHKNHITVLNAIKILKDKGEKDILILFSGRESDARNPNFFEQLKEYVYENDIETNARFLGFIDRSEQLQLMNRAIAIIQPSLFEGWSTVVEDAKAMSQHIIISDIPVHREQININASFFSPLKSEELASVIYKLYKTPPKRVLNDYHENIIQFGEKFIEIANQAN